LDILFEILNIYLILHIKSKNEFTDEKYKDLENVNKTIKNIINTEILKYKNKFTNN